MRIALLTAALLLAACDKDRLPEDLRQAEGAEIAAEVNLAEAEPEAVENTATPMLPPVEADAAELEPPADPVEPTKPADPLEPLPEQGASFDCRAARGPVEQRICTVPELGALDRRVAATFARARDYATADQRQQLRDLGRRYLADRDRCRSDSCVRQAYRWYERDIHVVMGWPGPN